MRLADRPPQTLFGSRHRDQVDVIGHEAIAPYIHALFAAPLRHELHVTRVVLAAEKRLLPTVATLRYVVRHTRNH